MTLRGDMQFQIDVLWKCLREAQRRGDAALRSNREGSKIKQEIIDKLKTENEELEQLANQIYNCAMTQAIEVVNRALSQDNVSPVVCKRVIKAILNLTAEC